MNSFAEQATLTISERRFIKERTSWELLHLSRKFRMLNVRNFKTIEPYENYKPLNSCIVLLRENIIEKIYIFYILWSRYFFMKRNITINL